MSEEKVAHTPGPDAAEPWWTRGDEVEAHDIRSGRWRPAMIERDAPYSTSRGFITHGAYVLWRDLSPEDRSRGASSGGWIPAKSLRKAGA